MFNLSFKNYTSWRFTKECLEITKYWFGFCIALLENAIIFYYINYMWVFKLDFVLYLQNIDMQNFVQAVSF